MVSIARQPAINVGLVEEAGPAHGPLRSKWSTFSQPKSKMMISYVHMEHIIPIAARQNCPGGCLAHPDETKANPLTHFTNH